MSARTLEKPQIESPRTTSFTAPPAVRTTTRSRTKPEIRLDVKIQPVRKSRLKKSLFERVFLGSATFAALAFSSYLACGLLAQVKAETARQTGFRSAQRAESAVRSGQTVSERLEKVTAGIAIERWAAAHGMIKGEPVKQEENLVAWRN